MLYNRGWQPVFRIYPQFHPIWYLKLDAFGVEFLLAIEKIGEQIMILVFDLQSQCNLRLLCMSEKLPVFLGAAAQMWAGWGLGEGTSSSLIYIIYKSLVNNDERGTDT